MARKIRILPVAALTAGAAGAGLMFFFDPLHGRRRRSSLRDQALSMVRTRELEARRAGRDLRHRAHGLVAEAKGALLRHEVPDEILIERVRERLGRSTSHPHAIAVEVKNGHVRLTGHVLADEVDRLIDRLSAVRGVRSVEPALQRHESAEGVATMQDAPPGAPSGNWPPAARLLGALGGAAAIFGGRRRGGLAGLSLRALGATLIARALSNHDVLQFVDGNRCAIDLQKTIHIRAPVDEVYAWFSDLRNFPRFMSHVRDLTTDGESRSHWIVDGPAGTTLEWDAETHVDQPGRRIGWRSLPGGDIDHRGQVDFEPAEEGGTRLHVRLSYHPPAGRLGHAIASLFKKDPKRALDDDLLRFKSLIEEGKATAHGAQVRRGELHEPTPR